VQDKERDYSYNMKDNKPGGKMEKREVREIKDFHRSGPCQLSYSTHFLVQSFPVSVWILPARDENSFLGLLHC